MDHYVARIHPSSGRAEYNWQSPLVGVTKSLVASLERVYQAEGTIFLSDPPATDDACAFLGHWRSRWERNAAIHLQEVLNEHLDDELEAALRDASSEVPLWEAFVGRLAHDAGWDRLSTHLGLAILIQEKARRGRAMDYAPLDDWLQEAAFLHSVPKGTGVRPVLFSSVPPRPTDLEAWFLPRDPLRPPSCWAESRRWDERPLSG